MIIRLGDHSDIPDMMGLSRQFYKQTEYSKHVELCESTWSKKLEISASQGLLIVADDEGEIVGMLVGMYMPMMTNESVLISAELAWYVDKGYRSLNAGMDMMKLYRDRAKECGVKLFCMMSLEGVSPEAAHKIYTENNLIKTENTYMEAF